MKRSRAQSSEAAPSAPASRDARSERALKSIGKAIEADDFRAARRKVVDAHERKAWPSAARKVDWWRSALGTDSFHRLTQTLAEANCLYCESGIVRCQACEGRCETDGQPCDDCAALGVTPCSFCGGSGLAVLDDLPLGLRKAAMSNRLSMSLKKISKEQKRKPSAAKQAKDDSKAGRLRIAREIVRLNRLQGIVNNTLELLSLLARSNEPEARLPGPTRTLRMHECRVASETIDRLLRAQLATLGAHERSRAASLSGGKRDQTLTFASYFDALAKSKSFVNTSLHHRNVQRLMQQPK